MVLYVFTHQLSISNRFIIEMNFRVHLIIILVSVIIFLHGHWRGLFNFIIIRLINSLSHIARITFGELLRVIKV